MVMLKVNKGGGKGLLSGQANKAGIDPTATLALCLKHFDPNQTQKFEDWEAEKLLSKMLKKIQGYSGCHYLQCFNPKFKQYKSFPPTSEFKHPAHVPQDADWYVMHIEGLPCIAGHMVKNLFYLVFLDKDHKFWPSNIQNR
jgi:hypothetical protein